MKRFVFAVSAALLFFACAEPVRPVPELLFRYTDFPEIEHIRNLQGCAVYGDLLFCLQDKG